MLKEALQFSDQISADEVVKRALQEYIQHHKQLKLRDLFGTVEYHDDYNPKEQRNFKG